MRSRLTLVWMCAFATISVVALLGCRACDTPEHDVSKSVVSTPPESTPAESKQDGDPFWSVIERARGTKLMASADDVEAVLVSLSADQVIAFERRRRELMAASYTASLWGAAYVMNGGCSDDCFEYFRPWLMAHGRKTFEQALASPDSMAAIADSDAELEDLHDCASRAYKAKTGESLPDIASAPYPRLTEHWNFDDPSAMRRRYPKLVEKASSF